MTRRISRRDDALSVALWWQDLKSRNNETFLPLFFDQHRYLVLKGGGGSGKSIFAGQKILERATSEPGHKILVCRKVQKTLRNSCFAQLKKQARQYYSQHIKHIPEGESSEMIITFKNGSVILFSGLDDVEKLKSIFDITMIWIEEASEITEADFNQLDIRLRTNFPYYLQMIITFNPISITHWLKRRFFDYDDPRARVHESTYKDNRFLSRDGVETLEAYRETDEYYYMVYALGMWGVTGKTIFPGKLVAERLQAVQQQIPRRVGFFDYDESEDGIQILSWRWVEDPHGPIRIYREPEEGRPYIIGGDTAGDGSDWFVGQVLDNIDGTQVATLRHQYDEDTYAKQMYCLGHYYNEALLAVEANYSTYPVKLLQMMGYHKQYIREVEDDFDGKIRHAYGFRTDRLTRPVIIAELVRLMRDHMDCINDIDTLQEMFTFVRNEKLRPEAEPGGHDDCIMALAIAYYARPQQSMQVRSPSAKAGAHWTADMWQDYRNASPREREQLIKIWGKPRK